MTSQADRNPTPLMKTTRYASGADPGLSRRGIIAGMFAASASPVLALTDAPASEGLGVLTTPCAEWHQAHQRARALWSEVHQRRADLANMIGPRGLTIGTFALTDGEAVPIHVRTPKELRKLWRGFPDGIRKHQPAVIAAVQQACAAWDAIAEREGIGRLERLAATATDRAKALLSAV